MAIRTVCDLYIDSLTRHAKADMFRRKVDGSWQDISGVEFHRAVREVAQGLVSLGIQSGDRIALLSENRLEWAMLDLAALCCGACIVPIYPSLLPRQIEYILKDSAAALFVCSTAEHLSRLSAVVAAVDSIRHVVCFEEPSQDGVFRLDDLRAMGASRCQERPEEFETLRQRVQPEQLATIIYTSGTTGDPKGVMLTHDNLTSNVLASLQIIPLHRSDCCLSLLPLSHIFERMGGFYAMMHAGVTIAYAESIERAQVNLAEVRPTLMVAVPRFYEKIYAGAQNAAARSGPISRRIFLWAKHTGLRMASKENGQERISLALRVQQRLADRLVFRKLRARMGGRLRLFISGGAPLGPEIADFFHAAGLPILEGYGLSETSPIISLNTFDHFRARSVGRPIPGVEVRIAGDGEILTRSRSVMQGYLGKPEATAAAIVDGWFHTGDVGHLDGDGYLFITDRKKDILVTAGGKNVAPQPIESALKANKYIAEAVVIGDRRKYLTALLVPNFESLTLYARQHSIAHGDRSALVAHSTIQSLMQHAVDGVNAHLPSFEQLKYFRLLDHEFSLEAGELTPSLKVKRKVVVANYAAAIDSMYQES